MYAVNEIKLVNYTKQLGGIIPYFARLLHECINDFFSFCVSPWVHLDYSFRIWIITSFLCIHSIM
jgi:hypothetical protein